MNWCRCIKTSRLNVPKSKIILVGKSSSLLTGTNKKKFRRGKIVERSLLAGGLRVFLSRKKPGKRGDRNRWRHVGRARSYL